MTGKRFAAVVATILMIVGAIFSRSKIDDKQAAGTSATPTAPTDKGVLEVLCSTEFKDVCQDMQASMPSKVKVSYEPAGAALDRLSGVAASELPDLWLTLAPFPEMLDYGRQNPLVQSAETVAQAAPMLVLLADRADAFSSDCSNAAVWSCVGANAGLPWADHGGQSLWGTIRPGFADPATEAGGLVTLANAISGYFGTTDFSRTTWEVDGQFSRWMRNLSSGTKVTSASKSPLAILLTQSSALNVAPSDSAEIANSARAQGSQYTTLSPEPSISFTAQLARFSSTDTALTEQVSKFLTDSLIGTYSWSKSQEPNPALDEGTFIALRQLWKEYT